MCAFGFFILFHLLHLMNSFHQLEVICFYVSPVWFFHLSQFALLAILVPFTLSNSHAHTHIHHPTSMSHRINKIEIHKEITLSRLLLLSLDDDTCIRKPHRPRARHTESKRVKAKVKKMK